MHLQQPILNFYIEYTRQYCCLLETIHFLQTFYQNNLEILYLKEQKDKIKDKIFKTKKVGSRIVKDFLYISIDNFFDDIKKISML